MDRRTFGLAAASAMALAPAARAAAAKTAAFPPGFIWGAATAGHQVEGNNIASDLWLLENIKPTIFAERSGDAVDSLNRWAEDLDLCRAMGLNSYRFSIEWARIEPDEGHFSMAMLDHYRRIVMGCRERGLKPIVTFNHFTSPRWFSAAGNWTNPKAPDLFARYCERVARHLAADIDYALTFNEPQLPGILKWANLPPQLVAATNAMWAEAARVTHSKRFLAANVAGWSDFVEMQPLMKEGHRKARAAIKAVRPDLPVGLSLAVIDDQAVGRSPMRDLKRREIYEPWFEAMRDDDFVGVQNYERNVYDSKGKREAPKDAIRNFSGAEVYAPSLAGAVRYIHKATGKPIMVTEHGVGTEDDAVRARFIPESLAHLHKAMADGVPVLGYIHWSLMDNFEWIFGYGPKFGLVSVDRTTFKRTPKPSATVLGDIAKRNAL